MKKAGKYKEYQGRGTKAEARERERKGEEKKAGNNRPCNCGSGYNWVDCQSNSEYCG